MARHPEIPPALGAQPALTDAADELIEALRTGRDMAAEMFRGNPTPESWRAWVRAQAAFNVAYLAENGEGT